MKESGKLNLEELEQVSGGVGVPQDRAVIKEIAKKRLAYEVNAPVCPSSPISCGSPKAGAALVCDKCGADVTLEHYSLGASILCKACYLKYHAGA